MNRPFKIGVVAGSLLLAGIGMVSRGQIVQPLWVGNQTPVTNALGQTLRGTLGDSNNACLVEIRQVGSGIQPPDPVTGEGHANNPLLRGSYMGHNVSGTDPGMFSETFTNRLTNGVAYFARVFDAPAPADALYYADSVSFTNPPSHIESLDVVFQLFRLAHGDNAGDPDIDTDGDGIPDTMENEVTGTSPSRWDSDGDGFNDLYELTHDQYLRATDADWIDLWLHTPEVEGETHYISWWSIPGLAYRLGYYQQAEDPGAYSEVWSGTATETNLEIDVEAVMVDSNGFFRVFAVP